jgi:enoyl-CoA hydratase/carnithine racemase
LRKAKELILSGKPISSDEALKWGLCNKVCERPKLIEDVMAVARKIAMNAPLSVRNAKKAANNAI